MKQKAKLFQNLKDKGRDKEKERLFKFAVFFTQNTKLSLSLPQAEQLFFPFPNPVCLGWNDRI